MGKVVISGIIFGIIILLLLWNYKESSRLLRQAISPIMRDKGVIVIIQLVMTCSIFIMVEQPILNHQALNNIMLIKIFCLSLPCIVTYSAILYKLDSLNNNKYLTINICYLQGFKILPRVLWLILIILLAWALWIICSFILVALISMILGGLVWLICHYQEVSFPYEKIGSFLPYFIMIYMTIIMYLCLYYTYFATILVIIEKFPVLKAFKQSFKMVKKIPTRTIIIVISMFLLCFPCGILFGKNLSFNIFNSLWSLVLTSVSLVIYYQYKDLVGSSRQIEPN